MKVNQIRMSLVAASLTVTTQQAWTKEVIHVTAEEAMNIVSQKLDVAQSQNDAEALQMARNNISAISAKDGKDIYRHVSPNQTLSLELQILQVADKMQDKSYDRNAKPKAGIYGSVPWPPENERPKALRGKRLWMPKTPPERYKDDNPELYAFYKTLLEENQRNTEKYQHEGIVKAIRSEVLRNIRDRLKYECGRGTKSRYFERYLHLVNEIITDKQLRDEILSDIPIERRLPEMPPEEKTSP